MQKSIGNLLDCLGELLGELVIIVAEIDLTQSWPIIIVVVLSRWSKPIHECVDCWLHHCLVPRKTEVGVSDQFDLGQFVGRETLPHHGK